MFEKLVSGFLAVVTTITVGIASIGQPPQPTPTPEPVVAQKTCYESQYSWVTIDTTKPRPDGTSTVKPVGSPAPSSITKPPQLVVKKNLITCTGPDGKQFQTTQQECENFNAAWGSKQTDQRVCRDPDGNIVAPEKCAALWTKQQANPSQGSLPSGSATNPFYYPSQTDNNIPCQTMTGYYYTSPELCEKFKLQDIELQKSLEESKQKTYDAIYENTKQSHESLKCNYTGTDPYERMRLCPGINF